jgi:hypothetical protein
MILQFPAGYSTDPSVVRPGTSAALTARTIDATVKSPLGRAGDAVATIIPTMAERAPSPLLIGTLSVTLALALVVTRRMRFRPTALFSGALMLLPISSHQPPSGAAEFRHDGDGFVSPAQYAQIARDRSVAPPRNERVAVPMDPAPPVYEQPSYQPPSYAIDYSPPPAPPPAERARPIPSIDLVIPPEDLEVLTERGRALRDEAVRMALQFYADRRQIRRQIARMRLREQLRQLQHSDWHDLADDDRGRH